MNMTFFIIIIAILICAIIGFFEYSMIYVSKRSLEFDEKEMEREIEKQKAIAKESEDKEKESNED